MSDRLIIGIDQSFTATGLCVIRNGKVNFAGSFGIKKDGDSAWKIETSIEIDEVGVGLTDEFVFVSDIKSIIKLKWPGEVDRIFLYEKLLAVVLKGIFVKENPSGLPYFGIEVPLGNHQGFGVASEKAFVVALYVTKTIIGDESFLFKRLLTFYPATIKKFMTGKGNAKKDLVREAVRKELGIEIKSKDVADAIAIAKLVEFTINGGDVSERSK